MAMAYYPNYQMYPYSFSGQYAAPPAFAYPHGDPDPWRQARSALIHVSNMQKATESKPRLAKEEVEMLEAEFQRNHKPNSSLKKSLAEQMRVDVARINNWFQNRRAKAKQEARQRIEQARSEASSPNRDTDDAPAATNIPTEPKAEAVSPKLEGMSPILGGDSLEAVAQYTSPNQAPFEHSEPTFVVAQPEPTYYAHSTCDFTPMVAVSSPEVVGHAPIPLTVDIVATLQESAAGLTSFAPYAMVESPETMARPFAAFPSQLLPSDGISVKVESDGQESCEDMTPYQSFSPESVHSPPALSPDSIKTSAPATVDIASRRNMRRPAPLALRSFSYGPKTGMELPKRTDSASPMRRIASATGLSFGGRISKPVPTAPRSPMFLDKRQEAMLQFARSPVMGTPGQSIAPPTPNTPMVASQQALREGTVSSMSSEEEQKNYAMQHGAFPLDPSIRTPPATPSIGAHFPEGLFTHQYAPSDEPLATPLMGTFGTEPEFPPMSASVPSYIANGCVSQPSTPGYPPASMGPTYFAVYPGSNQEYNWSDAAAAAAAGSASSSPGQQARSKQLTFTNITPQDFQR